MKIKWYGHAAFLITSEEGVKIITDPYESQSYKGQIGYGQIDDSADIVLVSHDHVDHNDTKSLPGSPQIIKGAGCNTIKGISFKGIACHHDSSNGTQFGANVIFTFSIDGIRMCHLGDLGHILDDKELGEIGPIDLLLVPVGGHFTIDPKNAKTVAEQIQPKVVIPMHYKTEKCGFSIAPVEDFLREMSNVSRPNTSEASLDKDTLPKQMSVIVLNHAL